MKYLVKTGWLAATVGCNCQPFSLYLELVEREPTKDTLSHIVKNNIPAILRYNSNFYLIGFSQQRDIIITPVREKDYPKVYQEIQQLFNYQTTDVVFYPPKEVVDFVEQTGAHCTDLPFVYRLEGGGENVVSRILGVDRFNELIEASLTQTVVRSYTCLSTTKNPNPLEMEFITGNTVLKWLNPRGMHLPSSMYPKEQEFLLPQQDTQVLSYKKFYDEHNTEKHYFILKQITSPVVDNLDHFQTKDL
jgi:hypothetical protein